VSTVADAVVIGGGINGCCTAYYLVKRGVKKIILVEKGHIASGPTGRSSGIVRQHYSHRTLSAMARDSVKVWQDFANQVGGDAGFVQCGVVFLAGEKDADSFRKTVAMHQQLGIRENLLTADELKDMEHEICTDNISLGAYELDGGYADPTLAANSYCEAAQRNGVEVLKKTEVTALKLERGRIESVVTNHGEISTEVVINVAGPWGARIAAMAGVQIPLKASRHPVVVLQRPSTWRARTPVWIDLVTGGYFKPERSTSIVVGSIQDTEDEADMEDYSTIPSFQETETYSAAILKRFPVMEGGLAQGGWAGLYDVTPDWQPVIDRIPEIEGFYCAVGFSGHGFKIGPAVGNVMADLVIDGKCNRYDINLFRYARFQQNQSSRGAYDFGIIG
jgi:sarcosine oxidase, subunit beta